VPQVSPELRDLGNGPDASPPVHQDGREKLKKTKRLRVGMTVSFLRYFGANWKA